MSGDTLFIQQLRQQIKTVESSKTRPNDTNTYAAGDVQADSTSAATIHTFSGMAQFNGGGGIIQSITFIDSAAQALAPEFDLYLFDTAPTMQQDNAAFAVTDSEMLKLVARIRFPGALFVTGGANGDITLPCNQMYNCAAADSALYGVMVSRNAYIPIAQEVWKFRLQTIQANY